jgi:hypothetical protein
VRRAADARHQPEHALFRETASGIRNATVTIKGDEQIAALNQRWEDRQEPNR